MKTILTITFTAVLALAAPAFAHDPDEGAPDWAATLKPKPGKSVAVGKRTCPFGIARVRAFQPDGYRMRRMRTKEAVGFKDRTGTVVLAWEPEGRFFTVIGGSTRYIVTAWCRSA